MRLILCYLLVSTLTTTIETANAFVLTKTSSKTAIKTAPFSSSCNVIADKKKRTTRSLLWGTGGSSSGDYPGDGEDDHLGSSSSKFPWARNKARTDIRYFLTQRSIQSFVYLLNQCREEHTVHFLEKTLDFTNIDKYHGTGAFNQTMFPKWDSIFLDYVSRPEETIVVSVKQRQRRRSSLSGRNEYLEEMASKSAATPSPMKSIKDLNTKPSTPSRSPPRGIAGSYLDSLSCSASADTPKQEQKPKPPSHSRPKGCAANYLDSLSNPSTSLSSGDQERKPMGEITNNPYVEEKTVEYRLEVDPSSIVRRILAVREQLSQEWIQDLDTLMQLNDDIMETYEEYMEQQSNGEDDEEEDMDESAMAFPSDGVTGNVVGPVVNDIPNPYSDTLESSWSKQEKAPIFDVNAWYGWSQSLFSRDRDSSPFRKKNFDLLLLLSTQESIHRVLKSYKKDDSVRPETFDWLLDFYKDRVKAYFDGHQSFGRAEAFLEEMLQSPPTVIETDTKALGVIAWVNPAKIAEDIVRERSEVALSWMKAAEATQDDHTDLRRLLFTNMVTKSEPEKPFSDTIISSSLTMDEHDIINPNVGVFE